jgi:hypothetical protein
MQNEESPKHTAWNQVRDLYRQSFVRHDPAARTAEQERRKAQALAKRLEALEVTYQAACHYCDQEFVEQHAQVYADDLVARRDEIRRRYTTFHHDQEFVALLSDQAPHLLQFVKWEVNALALAERFLIARAKEEHRPLTPEEKATRIRRFRERAIERERTRIDDATAMAAVAFESIEELLDARNAKIEEIRARGDLDSAEREERIRAITAITDHRLARFSSEEKSDGAAHDTTSREAGTPSAAPVQEPVVLDD